VMHVAMRYNTLQHSATRCNIPATHCDALQHTATHCNALQQTRSNLLCACGEAGGFQNVYDSESKPHCTPAGAGARQHTYVPRTLSSTHQKIDTLNITNSVLTPCMWSQQLCCDLFGVMCFTNSILETSRTQRSERHQLHSDI